MKVFIVDDEPFAARRLNLALKDMSDVQLVGVASDGDSALREIRRVKPDLVILDIELPGRSGIEVAAALEREGGPEIVFLTAFDRYAMDAFTVEATDYLLKPVRPERLRQAVERAARRRVERDAGRGANSQGTVDYLPTDSEKTADAHRAISLTGRDADRNLLQSEILWIEAAKDYALIHTLNRTHIIRTTMAELAINLRPSIIRVHRSAFVAIEAIHHRLRSSKGIVTLVLVDGSHVQVGPSYARSTANTFRAAQPER